MNSLVWNPIEIPASWGSTVVICCCSLWESLFTNQGFMEWDVQDNFHGSKCYLLRPKWAKFLEDLTHPGSRRLFLLKSPMPQYVYTVPPRIFMISQFPMKVATCMSMCCAFLCYLFHGCVSDTNASHRLIPEEFYTYAGLLDLVFHPLERTGEQWEKRDPGCLGYIREYTTQL